VGFSFCHVLEAFGCSTPQLHLYNLIKSSRRYFALALHHIVSCLPTCPDVLDSEVTGVACVILDLPLLLSEATSVTAICLAYVLIILAPTDWWSLISQVGYSTRIDARYIEYYIIVHVT
jgi:hypothetical protein